MPTDSTQATPRDVLVALTDAVVLVEPLLLRLWKSSRLTLGHLRVLRALRDQPRSAGELAALIGTAPPTMARTLARLEERGLLRRSIDLEDRRRIEVTLTRQGAELLNTSRVFKDTAFQRAAAALTDEERVRLIESLGRLVDLARSHPGEELGRAEALDDVEPAQAREGRESEVRS